MPNYKKEFRKIARRLTLADLQFGFEDEKITMESILDDSGRIKADTRLFLGLFTEKGIKRVLDEFGITKVLERKGLKNLRICIDTSDPFLNKLFIYFDGKKDCEHCICELVVKKDVTIPSRVLPIKLENNTLNFLHIEWLLLQDPTKSFSPAKPALPGQRFPGLGLGDMLMELLILLGKRLSFDGISNKPAHFYTAYMFTRVFYFVNSKHQALIEAAKRQLLPKYTFFQLAWAFYYGCVINKKTYEIINWEPDWLILPLSKVVLKYFNSQQYKSKVKEHIKNFQLEIDMNKLSDKLKEKSS